MLGRPGAVLAGAEVAGTWRARKAGRRLTVTVARWAPVARTAVEEQAERLAQFRGLTLAAVDVE